MKGRKSIVAFEEEAASTPMSPSDQVENNNDTNNNRKRKQSSSNNTNNTNKNAINEQQSLLMMMSGTAAASSISPHLLQQKAQMSLLRRKLLPVIGLRRYQHARRAQRENILAQFMENHQYQLKRQQQQQDILQMRQQLQRDKEGTSSSTENTKPQETTTNTTFMTQPNNDNNNNDPSRPGTAPGQTSTSNIIATLFKPMTTSRIAQYIVSYSQYLKHWGKDVLEELLASDSSALERFALTDEILVYPNETCFSHGLIVLIHGTILKIPQPNQTIMKQHYNFLAQQQAFLEEQLLQESMMGRSGINNKSMKSAASSFSSSTSPSRKKSQSISLNLQNQRSPLVLTANNPDAEVIRAPAIIGEDIILAESLSDYYLKADSYCQYVFISAKELHEALLKLPRAVVAKTVPHEILLSREVTLRQHFKQTPPLLRCSWITKDMEPKTLYRLMLDLEPRSFLPGEEIAKEGSVAPWMVFLRRGEAELMSGGVVVMKLRPGDTFGEMSVLFGEPRLNTLRSTTLCDVWILHRRSVGNILRMADSQRSVVRKAAKMRRVLLEQLPRVHSHSPLREQVPYLRGMPDAIFDKMVHTSKAHVFPVGLLMVASSETCDALVVIVQGSCVSQDANHKRFHGGDVLGINCLIPHRWPHGISATTMVDSFILARPNLEKALRAWGEYDAALRYVALEIRELKRSLTKELLLNPPPSNIATSTVMDRVALKSVLDGNYRSNGNVLKRDEENNFNNNNDEGVVASGGGSFDVEGGGKKNQNQNYNNNNNNTAKYQLSADEQREQRKIALKRQRFKLRVSKGFKMMMGDTSSSSDEDSDNDDENNGGENNRRNRRKKNKTIKNDFRHQKHLYSGNPYKRQITQIISSQKLGTNTNNNNLLNASLINSPNSNSMQHSNTTPTSSPPLGPTNSNGSQPNAMSLDSIAPKNNSNNNNTNGMMNASTTSSMNNTNNSMNAATKKPIHSPRYLQENYQQPDDYRQQLRSEHTIHELPSTMLREVNHMEQQNAVREKNQQKRALKQQQITLMSLVQQQQQQQQQNSNNNNQDDDVDNNFDSDLQQQQQVDYVQQNQIQQYRQQELFIPASDLEATLGPLASVWADPRFDVPFMDRADIAKIIAPWPSVTHVYWLQQKLRDEDPHYVEKRRKAAAIMREQMLQDALTKSNNKLLLSMKLHQQQNNAANQQQKSNNNKNNNSSPLIPAPPSAMGSNSSGSNSKQPSRRESVFMTKHQIVTEDEEEVKKYSVELPKSLQKSVSREQSLDIFGGQNNNNNTNNSNNESTKQHQDDYSIVNPNSAVNATLTGLRRRSSIAMAEQKQLSDEQQRARGSSFSNSSSPLQASYNTISNNNQPKSQNPLSNLEDRREPSPNSNADDSLNNTSKYSPNDNHNFSDNASTSLQLSKGGVGSGSFYIQNKAPAKTYSYSSYNNTSNLAYNNGGGSSNNNNNGTDNNNLPPLVTPEDVEIILGSLLASVPARVRQQFEFDDEDDEEEDLQQLQQQASSSSSTGPSVTTPRTKKLIGGNSSNHRANASNNLRWLPSEMNRDFLMEEIEDLSLNVDSSLPASKPYAVYDFDESRKIPTTNDYREWVAEAIRNKIRALREKALERRRQRKLVKINSAAANKNNNSSDLPPPPSQQDVAAVDEIDEQDEADEEFLMYGVMNDQEFEDLLHASASSSPSALSFSPASSQYYHQHIEDPYYYFDRKRRKDRELHLRQTEQDRKRQKQLDEDTRTQKEREDQEAQFLREQESKNRSNVPSYARMTAGSMAKSKGGASIVVVASRRHYSPNSNKNNTSSNQPQHAQKENQSDNENQNSQQQQNQTDQNQTNKTNKTKNNKSKKSNNSNNANTSAVDDHQYRTSTPPGEGKFSMKAILEERERQNAINESRASSSSNANNTNNQPNAADNEDKNKNEALTRKEQARLARRKKAREARKHKRDKRKDRAERRKNGVENVSDTSDDGGDESGDDESSYVSDRSESTNTTTTRATTVDDDRGNHHHHHKNESKDEESDPLNSTARSTSSNNQQHKSKKSAEMERNQRLQHQQRQQQQMLQPQPPKTSRGKKLARTLIVPGNQNQNQQQQQLSKSTGSAEKNIEANESSEQNERPATTSFKSLEATFLRRPQEKNANFIRTAKPKHNSKLGWAMVPAAPPPKSTTNNNNNNNNSERRPVRAEEEEEDEEEMKKPISIIKNEYPGDRKVESPARSVSTASSTNDE